MSTLAALIAGVVAGLAIAVPVGAIAVLLIHEGLEHGHRAAVGGAFGIATVDLVYSTLAVVAGGVVTALLSGRELIVGVVASLVLLAVGVRGMVVALRARGAVGTADPPLPRSAGGAYLRFVGLTAINPATALYFVALATTLGPRLGSGQAAAGFVLGVFVGSLSWQLVLALSSATLGPRLGPRLRRATSIVGFGVVIVLAVVLGAEAILRG